MLRGNILRLLRALHRIPVLILLPRSPIELLFSPDCGVPSSLGLSILFPRLNPDATHPRVTLPNQLGQHHRLVHHTAQRPIPHQTSQSHRHRRTLRRAHRRPLTLLAALHKVLQLRRVGIVEGNPTSAHFVDGGRKASNRSSANRSLPSLETNSNPIPNAVAPACHPTIDHNRHPIRISQRTLESIDRTIRLPAHPLRNPKKQQCLIKIMHRHIQDPAPALLRPQQPRSPRRQS